MPPAARTAATRAARIPSDSGATTSTASARPASSTSTPPPCREAPPHRTPQARRYGSSRRSSPSPRIHRPAPHRRATPGTSTALRARSTTSAPAATMLPASGPWSPPEQHHSEIRSRIGAHPLPGRRDPSGAARPGEIRRCPAGRGPRRSCGRESTGGSITIRTSTAETSGCAPTARLVSAISCGPAGQAGLVIVMSIATCCLPGASAAGESVTP